MHLRTQPSGAGWRSGGLLHLVREHHNCFFKDNVATGGSGGGGLWFGSGGSSLVANCTVIENQANAQAQGGIRVQGAAPRIVNCILWGNTGSGAPPARTTR